MFELPVDIQMGKSSRPLKTEIIHIFLGISSLQKLITWPTVSTLCFYILSYLLIITGGTAFLRLGYPWTRMFVYILEQLQLTFNINTTLFSLHLFLLHFVLQGILARILLCYIRRVLWTGDGHLPSASARIKSWAATAADPQHPLEGVQGGDQEWDTLCSGKTGRTGLQIIRIFRGRFYEPHPCISLYLEKKSIKSVMATSVPRNQQWHSRDQQQPSIRCVLDCTYLFLHQNHICTNISPRLFGAVFQSYLKSCLLGYSPRFAPNKTFLSNFRCCIVCIFFDSVVNISMPEAQVSGTVLTSKGVANPLNQGVSWQGHCFPLASSLYPSSD